MSDAYCLKLISVHRKIGYINKYFYFFIILIYYFLIGPIESIDDPQESPPTDRAMNIEEFKKELTLKREARQRAIAAVSSEMERLRRELDAEKEAHSETSRMLDLLRSAQNDAQAQTSVVNNTLKRCTDIDQKQDERDLAMQRLEAQRLFNILKVNFFIILEKDKIR